MTQSHSYPRRLILAKPFITAVMTVLLVAILCPVPAQNRAKTPAPDPEEYWVNRVEPLLDKQCLKCHAGVRQQGGLDLRSLDTILRGGAQGPAIIPGRPAESRILQYIQPGSAPHMPPDPKKQLSAADIATLKTWIAMLPAPKIRPASGASATGAWAADYLARYRRSIQTKEVPPANLPPIATIDWFLSTDWRRDNIQPSRPGDDSTFARRLYLDIAGRIPSSDELKLFLADARPDRRARLAAKLIDSEDYPRHMREVFDTVLMGRPTDRSARKRADSGWYAFLEDAFRRNRPWNEAVRDILVARQASGPGRGAVQFLAERGNNYQSMAEAAAPVVFGVQIKCAQCHNHPLAWEIEQRHYWIVRPAAIKLLTDLRSDGIAADMDYRSRKFGPQIKRADELGAQYTLILGESEVEKEIVQLRSQTTK